MGNQGSRHVGKIVLPDGSIRSFEEPLTAAELMLEHPQQVVAELSTNKLTPLPADDKLELHKLYLMLPLRRGNPPCLSSNDAHQILLRVNAVMGIRSALRVPLFARICAVRGSSVAKSHCRVVKEDKEVEIGVGRSYEMKRCVSGKGWKPSLDTIEERKEGKKEVSLMVVAGDLGRRIHTKGLVWG